MRNHAPPQGEEAIKFSLRFWIGIILLTTNQPLGWAAMLACNAIAINKQSIFFTYLGFALYALSWGMLGLGVLLAGPEGIRYSRLLLKKAWQCFIRLFKIRQR
ncbi:MAG: hypothetical protein JRD43_04825 [Deltaproteobacteria bacterium]|nr:hypothetical protein [Deltaproteobacteria bacterium]MBW2595035.1 hypothetical protein [Deltaproteobacteria bacterium]MBW2649971.1 hypothetical protein [Deltaproteobacteria bacterium]